MTTRTFPKRCGKCGQKAMQLATVPYATNIEHDGRTYRVEIPDLAVPRCAHCQALSLDDEARPLVLTPQKATLLIVAVVVLLGIAFAAGFLIAARS